MAIEGKSKTRVRLSKSRIADGLSCPKKAYLAIRQPELKAPVGKTLQARFDAGNEVGDRARKLFPVGKLIDRKPWEVNEGIYDTQQVVASGCNTIFEASFGNEQFHCRLDIASREDATKPWTVYEVKSGVSPKPEYVLDLAIQCWILDQCNIAWEKAVLVYLDRTCRFPDLSNLFIKEEVTDKVRELYPYLDSKVPELLGLASADSHPTIGIGKYCEAPYECSFKKHCWQHVPTYSVFDLPLGWKLFEKGWLKIEDIQKGGLTPTQRIPYKALSEDFVHTDREGIKSAISSWLFPIFHLDFETINPAIPRFEDTGPYTQIPFQFSLHVQTTLNETQHFEYLHTDATDPRRNVAEKLVEWIPDNAQVVMAYNSKFESDVLEDLANLYPDLSTQLRQIQSKLVDPLPVLKKCVYHKDFRGSFSIKDVAPVLLGERWRYDKLEVGDGKMAQVVFDEMVNTTTLPERKAILRRQLLQYCSQDTLAMVELLTWMFNQ